MKYSFFFFFFARQEKAARWMLFLWVLRAWLAWQLWPAGVAPPLGGALPRFLHLYWETHRAAGNKRKTVQKCFLLPSAPSHRGATLTPTGSSSAAPWPPPPPSLQVNKLAFISCTGQKTAMLHWLQYSYFSVSLQTHYRGPDQLGWVENGYCLIIWIIENLRLSLKMLSWYVAIKWLGNSGSPGVLT